MTPASGGTIEAATAAAVDVIVVGAGLTGLSTAWHCARAGLRVEVLEARDRAGGVIGTHTRDGALWETGPNSALDTPLAARLLRELGIDGERIGVAPAAARRYVVRGGRLVPLPMSPPALLRTRAFGLGAKLRLLREPFVAPAPAGLEETVAAFARRRLGSEIHEYVVDPFVAGIYAGDPERLSLPAAFPRLHALEQEDGSLLRGQMRARRARVEAAKAGDADAAARPANASFSFRQGMQTLTDALARALPALRLGTTVEHIARDDGGFRVAARDAAGATHTLRSQTVVLTVPADVATALLAPHDAEACDALRGIDYAPVAVVASLYERSTIAHSLDGFGFLVPRVEGRRVLGTLFSSTMFPDRAPRGTALLTTFAGGRRHPQDVSLADDALGALVREDLAGLLGARTPRWQTIVRWPRAIPQYDLGHLARIAKLEALETRMPGLHVRGNYRGGVSVGDCLRSGESAAQDVVARLKG